MTNLPDATAIRDALVPLIRARSRNPLRGLWNKRIPVLKFELRHYTLVLGGPYAAPPEGKAFFMLEVHHPGEELFCHRWDEDGNDEVLNFVRGPWETTLLKAFA